MESQLRKHFNSTNTALIVKLIQPILQHCNIEYIDLTNLESIAILDKFDSHNDLYVLKGLVYQLCGNDSNMKKCYKKACANGNLVLGVYYHKSDNDKCVKYYLRAIESKNSDAMCKLGIYYDNNGDVPNMLKYYQMAIEHGDSKAMYNLGLYYYNNDDEPNMIKYYQMAIEHGDSKAMYNLGLYYDNIRDISNMISYYLIAIEHGNSKAMHNLGFYYSKQNDIPNMTKYYQIAIEHGNSYAMHNLGLYYKHQNDVPNMIKYCQMAVEHGNSSAMYVLGLYYSDQNDVPNMIKYCQMAVEHGTSDALKYLAIYHENNSSTEAIIEFYHQNLKYNTNECINKLTSYISEKYKDIELKLIIKSFMLVADQNNDTNQINLNTYIIKKINSYNKTNAQYDQDTEKCIIDYINLNHDIVQNNMPPFLKMYKKIYDEKIDLLDCHFKYSPGGEEFKEAKNDFIKLITQ